MKLFNSIILFTIIFISCKNGDSAKTTKKEEPSANTVKPVPAGPVSALPSFKMIDKKNQYFDLQQFKGKKVFVNLWATWCGPCRAEIPSIEALASKTDPGKTEFILLSLDDNFETAKSYAIKTNMKLPVYFPASTLPALFQVQGIPTTYIFNEHGEIVFEQTGSIDYNTQAFADMLK